ncbi:hypothetical protein K435DRAFT_558463, partial [Dendrothele bispora CBS 962.96]
VNTPIVAPARAAVVKPDELDSFLALPLRTAISEPQHHPSYLAASMTYGFFKSDIF